MSEIIWKNVKIKDWCNVFTGGTPSKLKKEYWDKGTIKWMMSGDVNQIRITDVEGRITEAGLENSNARLMPKKTVVIALNGQGKTRGMAGITEIELTCNQSIAGIYPKKEKTIYPDFLFWNIYSRYKEIRYLRGGEFRSGLNMQLIRELEFPVPFKNNQPDLEEQKRIVDKVDKLFAEVDIGRNRAEKSFADSEKLLSSELKILFGNKSYKNFKLKELLDINWGETSITKKSYIEKGYPAYSATGQDGYLKDYQCEGLGIVLSAIGARCGKCFLADGKWTAIKNTIVIRAKDKKFIDYRYFYYYLNDKDKWRARGAGQPFISQAKANEIEIPLPIKGGKPDALEQKRISQQIEKIEILLELLKQQYKNQVSSFEYLKRSFLNQAFAGKLVIVGEPALQKVNIFPIQQAIGAVLQRFERGEMVVAKILYLAQTINRVPLGIPFTPQNFGPYDTAIKKAITAGLSRGNKFFTRKKYGKGFIYTLSPNAQKLFKYSNSKVLRTMSGFLNEMMPYFKKASSADIERLASVCEIIRETKNVDKKEIYSKLSEWKPNKFNLQEVKKTLRFINVNDWDKILIQ